MSKNTESIAVIVERFDAKGQPVAHVEKTLGQPPIRAKLPYGIPGDKFFVTLGKTRRGQAKASILSLDTASIHRVMPLCVHAETCGGCPWQTASYAAQLAFKQQQIATLFVGHLNRGAHLGTIIPCENHWGYRNKMEFSFSQDNAGERYLGLMMRSGRGRVFHLKECHIGSRWMVEALHLTRSWWQATSLAAYHPHRDTGTLRTLTVREGKRTGAKMAILTVSGRPEFAISKKELVDWTETMKNGFPGISCFLRIQQACKGMPTQFYECHLTGPEELEEKMHIDLNGRSIELALRISPSSFFQTNTYQAERVYSEAMSMLDLAHDEHIIDLYAGTATIGMVLAHFVKQVTSIELNPYAVLDAEANIAANGITNLTLMQGDAGEVLTQFCAQPEGNRPEVVVVDPPRNGLGPKALKPITELKPSKILYISCNPKTQAVDVDELVKQGYILKRLQPIDQFPHTQHVENIALLSRS
ncbi:MAG: 23S rRNA (uracil(1939)-C(5))-methyltransferase RlmD [Simkania sp.]|nr:23S rRNA (uracil(1939)-C(5))-methyltransferase RlmD [Simkania sp.]